VADHGPEYVSLIRVDYLWSSVPCNGTFERLHIDIRIGTTTGTGPDFDSQKHPPLQPFEYPPVIKSEIFQGESLHFGYLCEHVYPQAQKQIGHGQRGRGGQEFGEVP